MTHAKPPAGRPLDEARTILHVVGLFSPDNAYGGPVTVALNLARAQRHAGHKVVVIGGYRGWATAPRKVGGQPVVVRRSMSPLQRNGLHGLFSPGLILWTLRHVRKFDVVHLHLTRDLTTLPIAAIAAFLRVPYVIQPHGQVDRSERSSAKLIDALLTRRVLRGAAAIAHLTPTERDDLLGVDSEIGARLTQIPNGVPLPAHQAAPGDSSEVLFAARLHPRKRALVFVEAAATAAPAAPDASFVLAGADEGDGILVEQAIAASGFSDRIEYVGALDHAAVLRRMSEAAAYVLPSLNEVFPMTVLEALAEGLPVVLGRSSALAEPIRGASAGIVVSDGPESYADAIRTIMTDPALRRSMGANARRLVEDNYSIEHVATLVDQIYSRALA